jgi:hypothetical protein
MKRLLLATDLALERVLQSAADLPAMLYLIHVCPAADVLLASNAYVHT